MLYLGLSAIVFVPIFKTITHLPPYVGMMLSLAVVATFAEIYSSSKIAISSVDPESDAESHHSPVHSALTKIELPKYFIFLGNFNGCGCAGIPRASCSILLKD